MSENFDENVAGKIFYSRDLNLIKLQFSGFFSSSGFGNF